MRPRRDTVGAFPFDWPVAAITWKQVRVIGLIEGLIIPGSIVG
jgi:hypothetical protein